MPKITFKEVYTEAKTIIERNDPKARISKLSSVGIEQINKIIRKPVDGKVRSVIVENAGFVISAKSVKKTYVKFMKEVCKNENAFEILKNKGWIFNESEIRTSKGDYDEIGRTGAYIYTNCNIDLLIVKFVKTIVDIKGKEGLDDYVFLIDFSGSNIVGTEQIDAWWPSQEEYPLNLTKEDWKKYILEVELPEHPQPMKMLKGMLELGGEATCKQLSETYGSSPNTYSGCVMNLGRRVKDYFRLPPCMDGDDERYFLFPFVRKYRGGCKDNYIYRIRPELQKALNEIDLSDIDPHYERGEEQLSTQEVLQHIYTHIAAAGYTFDEKLISNYYLSLKAKPFVILGGISGTGKTKLVELFAEAIGATYDNGQYLLVPVRPDWSDSTDLLGYINLSGEFVPRPIIDFICEANKEENKDKPYFLCLDEMNLARVEYYLSDILSIIESRKNDGSGRIKSLPLLPPKFFNEKTKVAETNESAQEKYGQVYLSDNLYIIGTVNMDETTFPFSKKVLDRANTIEFSKVDTLIPDFSKMQVDANSFEETKQEITNEFLRPKYAKILDCVDMQEIVVKYCNELQELNTILAKAELHVGYRVRDEIVFYLLYNHADEILNEVVAMDNQIMQKILPRIQGSGSQIVELLDALIEFCGSKYVKSAEKLVAMKERCGEYGEGYTSFWL